MKTLLRAPAILLAIVFGISTGIFLGYSLERTQRAAFAAGNTEGKKAAYEQAEIFRMAAKTISPSVVNITAMKRRTAGGSLGFDDYGMPFFVPPKADGEMHPAGIGSGFIIDANKGYVLTNSHVVTAGQSWIVRLADKREVKAELVGNDPQTDIALLKIDADHLQGAKLGDSSELQVGDWVLAVGNPFGLLEQTVTAGIISAKGRRGLGLSNYEDYLQTDAAINMGNSGGPLVNLEGEVVGITTAILSGSGGYQGIGFAIPSNQAKSIIDQIVQHGKVVRGWIGVEVKSRKGQQGTIVEGVLRHGPAHLAGIQPGDIVLQFAGKDVRDPDDMRDIVSGIPPGSKVPVEIERNGATSAFEITIGTQPKDWALPNPDE